MTATLSPAQVAAVLKAVDKARAANPNDPRIPQAIAKLKAAGVEIPQTQNPAPERSFGGRVADAAADALPVGGALAGGALGATTGPLGIAAIPAGGAAGYSAGEFFKRLIDKASGRPGTVPPVNVPASMAKGATEAMNASSAGNVLGAAASGLKDVGSFASKLKGSPTQYARLSGSAFTDLLDRLGFKGNPSGPNPNIVASVPITSAERLGARYATPKVDAARGQGVEMLKGMGERAAEDAALLRRGEGAARLIPRVEAEMQANVPKLADASGKAIDATRKTIGPYDSNGTMKPPGEDVVNAAFNAPNTQNKLISDPQAMSAFNDVKSLGQQQGSAGSALDQARFDLYNANRAGLTPGMASAAENDADTLNGISASLQKQRGGVVQGRPGPLNTVIRKAGEIANGPESTRFGLRPETPEASILNASRRQAEVEAARRGMTAPWSNQTAFDPQTRPLMDQIASPGGRTLSGAQFELLRQALGIDQ